MRADPQVPPGKATVKPRSRQAPAEQGADPPLPLFPQVPVRPQAPGVPETPAETPAEIPAASPPRAPTAVPARISPQPEAPL